MAVEVISGAMCVTVKGGSKKEILDYLRARGQKVNPDDVKRVPYQGGFKVVVLSSNGLNSKLDRNKPKKR